MYTSPPGDCFSVRLIIFSPCLQKEAGFGGLFFFGSISLSTENSGPGKPTGSHEPKLGSFEVRAAMVESAWLAGGGPPLFLGTILSVDYPCGRSALDLMSTRHQMRRSRSKKILAEGGIVSQGLKISA